MTIPPVEETLAGLRLSADPVSSAVTAFTRFLGVESTQGEGEPALFAFPIGQLEITAGSPGDPVVAPVALQVTGPPAGWQVHRHGILVEARRPGGNGTSVVPGFLGLDHVVVQSPNLDRALELWANLPGWRLALDRTFPERGLRILFLRSGRITLEIVGPPDGRGSEVDRLWGVALRVLDLESLRARLAGAGFDVSAVRPGHRRGSLVATVREGLEGLPALLLQDLPRDAP